MLASSAEWALLIGYDESADMDATTDEHREGADSQWLSFRGCAARGEAAQCVPCKHVHAVYSAGHELGHRPRTAHAWLSLGLRWNSCGEHHDQPHDA